MSDSTLAPGFVRFIQHRLPMLRAGDYRLRVTQDVAVDGRPYAGAQPDDLAQTQYFAVAGERFAIDPTEIDSVYPPAGSQGEYAKVLPHLVLSRPMLPWLRSPLVDPAPPQDDDDVAAWLALLVFDAAEAPQLQSLTLGALAAPPSGTASYPILQSAVTTGAHGDEAARPMAAEQGYADTTPCQAIDLSWADFRAIAPTVADLKWLATVRTVAGKRTTLERPVGSASQAGEYAVIMANRLPQPDRKTTVHLVSLEGMEPYLEGGSVSVVTPPATVRLVSFYRWDFDSLGGNETFGDAVEALRPDMRPFGSGETGNSAAIDEGALPASADSLVARALAAGYVALPHMLRDGGRTASWYRGPLSPVPAGGALLAGGPLGSADAALLFDPATGFFDASYAAAWQLGRMLALADPDFAPAFYRWRHLTALAATRADEAAFLHAALRPTADGVDSGATLHMKAADLLQAAAQTLVGGPETVPRPAAATTPDADDESDKMPLAIADWLSGLRALVGVPFRYLTPAPDMLPAESIRFFHVDSDWTDALVDGAYSLGAATAGDLAGPSSGVTGGTAVSAPTMSGFLLNSHVVKHWPGLQADAFAVDGTPLIPVRFEKLSDTILLALFNGQLGGIDLHEPPEALHYGVDIMPGVSATGQRILGKRLRDCVNGARPQPPRVIDTLPFRGAPGVIDVGTFAAAAHVASGSPPRFTSAEFSLAMVEGVDRVTFLTDSAKDPHA